MIKDFDTAYIDYTLERDYPAAMPEEPSLDGVQLAMGGSGAGKYKSDQTMVDAGIGLFDTLAGALRGTTAQALGLPGDVESLVRMLTGTERDQTLSGLITGQQPRATILPTTEDMNEMLPPVVPPNAPNAKQRQKTADVANTLGEFNPVIGAPELVKPVVKGAKAAAKAAAPVAGQMIENYLTKTGAILKMAPDSPGIEVPAAPKLNTPAFKNWFGDSKVVDEKGQPLVVYHGTTRSFESFDGSKSGATDHGWYGSGAAYFSPTPSAASTYSVWRDMDSGLGFSPMAEGSKNSGANVIPVYLSIKNPYVWPEGRQAAKTKKEADTITKELIAAGYDGVFVPNKFAGGVESQFFEIVVFDPTQIKSLFNKGTWNPKDPRILHGGGAAAVTGTAAQDKENK